MTADAPPSTLVADDALLADLPRRSARGGVVQLGAQGAQLLLMIVSGAALARLLTPVDFGIVSMAATLTAAAGVVRDFGLPLATVQGSALETRDVTSLFWIGLRRNLVLGVVMVVLAPAVAALYRESRVIEVIAIVAFAGLVSGAGAQHEALLIRQMRFAALRFVDLFSLAMGMAVGVLLAVSGAGYRALVWQAFASAAVRTLALWRVCRWRPDLRGAARSGRVESLSAFGSYHTGARLLRHVGQNLDQAVVGYLFGARQLGFYDSAYRWSIAALKHIYTPLQNVAVAGLSRLQHNDAVFRVAVRRALLPVFSVMMPALAFAAVDARPIILLLLGGQWEPSVPFFRVLALAAIGNTVARGVNWLYLAEGQTRRQMRWALVSLPVSVAAILAGATRGALGVAVGFAAANWLLCVPEVVYALRASRVTAGDYFGAVARPLLGAAVAAAVTALVPLGPSRASSAASLGALLVSFTVYTVVYALTWLALPGGRAAVNDLVALWRASFSRRVVSA